MPLSDFEILSQLGEGASSTVYKVHRESDGAEEGVNECTQGEGKNE